MKNEQHYFMFSDGAYSDYAIGGLYTCEHGVTEQEWEDYLESYRVASREVRNATVGAWCAERGRVTDGNYSYGLSPNYDPRYNKEHGYFNKWDEWKRANNPQESFAKLHNMVRVDYTELHGGN